MATKNRPIGKVLHVLYLIATGGWHLLDSRSTKLYFPPTRTVHCSPPPTSNIVQMIGMLECRPTVSRKLVYYAANIDLA